MKPSDDVDECLAYIKTGLNSPPASLARDFAMAAVTRLESILANGHRAASHAPKRARKKKAAEPTPVPA